MLNKVVIQGRLTGDPELRTTQNGTSVTPFTVAVQADYAKAGEEKATFWIDVVAWRSTAEFVNKYFGKGDMIIVDGSLATRNYEDKQGNKRKAVEVMAANVYFCEGKKERPSEPVEPNEFEDTSAETPLPF